MARHKTITAEAFHYKWSKSHKPVLNIRSGDTVRFEINDVTSWQLNEKSKSDDLTKLDVSKFYPLAGPVYVEGARPRDTLVIDILSVKPADWGWSAILPGLGTLEEFKRPFLWKWDLKNGRYAPFKNGIKVPIKPFCGVLGVSPPGPGFFEVMPPGKHGGNMDIRHLTAGSRLKLPVWVQGALFSVGDVHAAQGDGEVCVTAIECAGEVTLRFRVLKNQKIESPEYYTRGDVKPRTGFMATTGISPDLMEATRTSVRNMIERLKKDYKLTNEEAYLLCSVAADVRVHEVVDKPNWVVGTMMPRDIFPKIATRE